jgi:hypothetical protein
MKICEICNQPLTAEQSVCDQPTGLTEDGLIIIRKVHLECSGEKTDYQLKFYETNRIKKSFSESS